MLRNLPHYVRESNDYERANMVSYLLLLHWTLCFGFNNAHREFSYGKQHVATLAVKRGKYFRTLLQESCINTQWITDEDMEHYVTAQVLLPEVNWRNPDSLIFNSGRTNA